MALSATAKKGGKLRVGMAHGAIGDSLDPATISFAYMKFVGYGLRNNLSE